MTDSNSTQIKYHAEQLQTYEVFNFFKDPAEVKKFLLGTKILHTGYFDPDDPGLRYKLDPENEVDATIIKEITDKIVTETGRNVKTIDAWFNINSMECMHGCIHVDEFEDNLNKYSGLIYMSVVFPIDCGTTLYYFKDLEALLNSNDMTITEFLDITHIVNSMHISPDNFVKQRCSAEAKRIMSQFDEFKKFEFAFNKFVAFPSVFLHSQNDYFSDSSGNAVNIKGAEPTHRLSFSLFFELEDKKLEKDNEL